MIEDKKSSCNEFQVVTLEKLNLLCSKELHEEFYDVSALADLLFNNIDNLQRYFNLLENFTHREARLVEILLILRRSPSVTFESLERELEYNEQYYTVHLENLNGKTEIGFAGAERFVETGDELV